MRCYKRVYFDLQELDISQKKRPVYITCKHNFERVHPLASIQSIRGRIGGIAKTKQITRSMRLVSSAKVQKARTALENCMTYYNNASYIMDVLASTHTGKRHRDFSVNEIRKTGIIALSTDRGLCGAYNMNVARKTLELVREKHGNVFLVTVGNKLGPILRHENIKIESTYMGISETPVFEEAELLSFHLIELYEKEEIDEIHIIYTRFESMLEQFAVSERLVPYTPSEDANISGIWGFEPEEEELISSATPCFISAALYRAMLFSALSEQSARVSSMDAAAKNSDELMERLTLYYNKMRQAGITNQIIEVVSGAAAQNKEGH